MPGIDFSELDRAGIDSAMFAVKNILDECEGSQYHLNPDTFAKVVKGESIHNPDNGVVTHLERIRYKQQLARILKFWDEYQLSNGWSCKESNGSSFKLVFERDEF